jgi:hypothetical protein
MSSSPPAGVRRIIATPVDVRRLLQRIDEVPGG